MHAHYIMKTKKNQLTNILTIITLSLLPYVRFTILIIFIVSLTYGNNLVPSWGFRGINNNIKTILF